MRTIVVAVVALALLATTVPGTSARAPRTVVAAVELSPEGGSAVRGFAYFRQRGRALSGSVVVWGLASGTRHAVHFHGPSGFCGRPPKPAVAAHEDLVANAQGVAFTKFSVPSTLRVVRRGFYYNVHAKPTAEGSSPSLACGDIRPVAR